MPKATNDSGEERNELFINSVAKAFKLLNSFRSSTEPLTLTALATATELSVGSTQRLVHTLEKLGLLQKNGSTKTYRPALALLDHAFIYLQHDSMVTRAAPYLAEIAKRTGETTNLSELDGSEMVYVARYPGHLSININLWVGTRLPVYSTAPGHAVLATLPPDEAMAILRANNRIRYTPTTITDLNKLAKRIAEVRELNYAISNQQMFVGDISIAAAVRDRSGRGIAAVNIAVPTSRFDARAAENKFAKFVLEGARAISAEIAG